MNGVDCRPGLVARLGARSCGYCLSMWSPGPFRPPAADRSSPLHAADILRHPIFHESLDFGACLHGPHGVSFLIRIVCLPSRPRSALGCATAAFVTRNVPRTISFT